MSAHEKQGTGNDDDGDRSGHDERADRCRRPPRGSVHLTGRRMDVGPATAEDCRAIAEVHVESWQRAYRGILPEPYLASLSVSEREAMWRRMVEQQPSHLLVVRAAGQVVGFIAFGASRDPDAPSDRAEVRALYVRATSWSTGAGRCLWLEALRRILSEGYTSVGLWVIAGNERAIRFYERAGFVAEPGSRKSSDLGGTMLEEVRYVCKDAFKAAHPPPPAGQLPR